MTENKIDKRFKTGLHSPFKYTLNTEFQDQKDYEWVTHLQKELRTGIKVIFKFLKDSCIHEAYLEGKIFAQYK